MKYVTFKIFIHIISMQKKNNIQLREILNFKNFQGEQSLAPLSP